MTKYLPGFFSAIALSLLALPQQMQGAEEPIPNIKIDIGPYFSGTIRGKVSDEPIAMKGIVVKLGPDQNAYICYDTDLMRASMGWTGDFLDFGNTQFKIAWPPPPKVKGTPAFTGQTGPGWAKDGDFTDPRPNHQGPLPKDWAKYHGLYLNGDKVILTYTVGNCAVTEMPEYDPAASTFVRNFEVGPSKVPLTMAVCAIAHEAGKDASAASQETSGKVNLLFASAGIAPNLTSVALVDAPKGAALENKGEYLQIKLPASSKTTRFKVALRALKADTDLKDFQAYIREHTQTTDLKKLCKGGPSRWNQTVATKGTVGTGNGPYVVDTITEPSNNPWNARTFFSGFDFFPDGRAAMCTFHGDVWVISGIDGSLDKLTWRRYATGLFQPLGLKIVNNTIYVLGRDQITRLHDLNKDGEADYFECFNNDCVVTSNYHEFALDLHTDSKGNFYFAKGAPWPPKVESPHQGVLFKISKDGSKSEIIATGFRAPNGMTVGPHDEITVSDNQGHWMPSSKLNWVKPGGFYGMVPTAHREPEPQDFDKPIAWLPMNMDNSSGGQTFVTSDKWGPFKGDLLFESYGKCTLFHVMTEEVDGQIQAGMVQFPLKFQSGLMRARFNPHDGQLYVAGLRGWQTSATRDGGFYRVRYTDKPVYMPHDLHVSKNGIAITFTQPLDTTSASSVDNYSVEEWNYKWSSDYGSPEFSVKEPGKKGHDHIEVKSARVSSDKKTVFLEIPEIRPVDQMKIKFNINAADGTAMSQEIYNTIHHAGPDHSLTAR